MTGCGCLLLIGAIVGLIAFMLFGSTDPGEPVEQLAALAVAVVVLTVVISARVGRVPLGRALVRVRDA